MMFFLKLFTSFLISVSALAQVDTLILSKETALRIERVPEFKFIQEEADKLGVKVFLFGGTASAFAHYVRWDLEREAGDEKYQAERFDYDFTNIYRGNQDLDIVVDGTAEQAAVLESILKEAYPHFVGSKDAWEVRLLDAQVGDKLPLLDNPDFLNQHTDTNSTGMIAVNAEPGEIIFRDLFSWENPDSIFLNDVASGRIKFLFNENHETTARFLDGKNPPVFAAIRYLAKLAQYEVDGFNGDLEIIKRIVEGTNWDDVKNNSYVVHKLEEFGKKVLLNAPDSEYAWNLLEETGLRKLLIEMDGGDVDEIESLAWWMNKEPLRTEPIGRGNGKTAEELFPQYQNEAGDIVVSHETRSFSAYENITRSSRGGANVFISRNGFSWEVAALGDGFYTKPGLEGAVGSNLTIRFKLKPEAREGTDFIYDEDYIVILNKAAIELIQENLNISMASFIKLLVSEQIAENDKGLLEKLKRKFGRVDINSDDFKNAVDVIRDGFFIADDFPEEFKYDISEINPKSISEMVEVYGEVRRKYFEEIITKIDKELFKRNPYWLERIIELNVVDDILAQHVLNEEFWSNHTDFFETIFERGESDWFLVFALTDEYWFHKDKEWIVSIVREIIFRGNADDAIARYLLWRDHWLDYPELVELLVERGDVDEVIVSSILDEERWAKHPHILMRIIEGENVGEGTLDMYIFEKDFWINHQLLLDYLEGREVTLQNLKSRTLEIKFDDWLLEQQPKSCQVILH